MSWHKSSTSSLLQTSERTFCRICGICLCRRMFNRFSSEFDLSNSSSEVFLSFFIIEIRYIAVFFVRDSKVFLTFSREMLNVN